MLCLYFSISSSWLSCDVQIVLEPRCIFFNLPKMTLGSPVSSSQLGFDKNGREEKLSLTGGQCVLGYSTSDHENKSCLTLDSVALRDWTINHGDRKEIIFQKWIYRSRCMAAGLERLLGRFCWWKDNTWASVSYKGTCSALSSDSLLPEKGRNAAEDTATKPRPPTHRMGSEVPWACRAFWEGAEERPAQVHLLSRKVSELSSARCRLPQAGWSKMEIHASVNEGTQLAVRLEA